MRLAPFPRLLRKAKKSIQLAMLRKSLASLSHRSCTQMYLRNLNIKHSSYLAEYRAKEWDEYTKK